MIQVVNHDKGPEAGGCDPGRDAGVLVTVCLSRRGKEEEEEEGEGPELLFL